MNFAQLRVLILVPVLFLLMGSVALVDPQPIAVPPGLSEKVVAQAVRDGVSRRGWIVNQESRSSMDATLHLRTHVARVRIDYDTRQVSIHYVGSENLDYEVKKGVPYIHRNYPKWINNTLQDISIALQQAAGKAEAK